MKNSADNSFSCQFQFYTYSVEASGKVVPGLQVSGVEEADLTSYFLRFRHAGRYGLGWLAPCLKLVLLAPSGPALCFQQ